METTEITVSDIKRMVEASDKNHGNNADYCVGYLSSLLCQVLNGVSTVDEVIKLVEKAKS